MSQAKNQISTTAKDRAIAIAAALAMATGTGACLELAEHQLAQQPDQPTKPVQPER